MRFRRPSRFIFPWTAGILLAFLPGCGHEVEPTPDYSDPDAIPVPGEMDYLQSAAAGVILRVVADAAIFAVIDGWHIYRGILEERTGELVDVRRLTDAPWTEQLFTDPDVADGVTYGYYVRTITPAGILSSGGPSVVVTVDFTPPAPPSGLSADVVIRSEEEGCPPGFLCASAVLTWQAPPDEEIGTYRLHRVPPFPTGDYVEWPFLRFEDPAVEPFVRYRYWVTALDFADNESASSGTVEVFFEAP